LNLELRGILDPSFFVVLERVDKSSGLVHLLFGLGSLLLKLILLLHRSVKLFLEVSFESLDFLELCFGLLEFLLSLPKLSEFDLEELKLGVHNL
jgi:hypothetical protein